MLSKILFSDGIIPSPQKGPRTRKHSSLILIVYHTSSFSSYSSFDNLILWLRVNFKGYLVSFLVFLLYPDYIVAGDSCEFVLNSLNDVGLRKFMGVEIWVKRKKELMNIDGQQVFIVKKKVGQKLQNTVSGVFKRWGLFSVGSIFPIIKFELNLEKK